ncbi:hypothetical protein M3P19_09715 [Muricauda sp. 2012CJ35-5]|uniref:phosphoribulokinase n=1 Tax=Flagellimonas spongiicola TaxID=2942208 RepID=A0ABT0PSC7_9FLAO|nr:hypothetical protein [Allomuricauda spongiicola]MCL6274287.1 hypothetical protein [Allomuricauda spongiicola]
MKHTTLFSLTDKQGIKRLGFLNCRLFWIGLTLKIVLSFFFAGEFLKNSFIPFVVYFFDSGFDSPYVYFQEIGDNDAFPYPPMMLYFLGFLGGFASNISPFFIRIPLLLSDIGILIILNRLLKNQSVKLLKYYWLSPVLIYISYIHGQLDAVPILFLFVSAYLLFNKERVKSSVFLGLGVAAKTNLLLVIPFFLLYIYKNNNEKKVTKFLVPCLVLILTFLIVNVPFTESKQFINMVYGNSEQSKIWNAVIPMLGELRFYIIPSIYLILLATASRFKRISNDLLLIFIGFSFAILLIFIPPQPGWYFWILPFFVYFAIRENKFSFLPILVLQGAFLAYFALIEDSDFFSAFLYSQNDFTIYKKLEVFDSGTVNLIQGLALTFLQTCLLLNVYWIYKWGIKRNLEKKIKNKPFLIGIGGDSGVGKSTLTELLTNLFGSENMTIIRGDDMHRWERGHDKWDEITHLSPKANHLYTDIRHLKSLKNGKNIRRRFYDHGSGKFTDQRKVYSNKILVFEGLHPFYISAKRDLFDLKVFVEPEEDLRLHWKISRDVLKRDYTKEKVIKQLQLREADSNKYIRSQASFSDIKVTFYTLNEIASIGNGVDVDLALRIEIENNVDVNELLEHLSPISSIEINHEYATHNQVIDAKGHITSDDIKNAVDAFIGDYDEFVEAAKFVNGLNGFLQLFLIYCIVYNVKHGN